MTAKEAQQIADVKQPHMWGKLPVWLTDGIVAAATNGYYESRFDKDVYEYRDALKYLGYRVGRHMDLHGHPKGSYYVSWRKEGHS